MEADVLSCNSMPVLYRLGNIALQLNQKMNHEMNLGIRNAVEADLAFIVDILNESIVSSTANFDLSPHQPEDKLEWFRTISRKCTDSRHLRMGLSFRQLFSFFLCLIGRHPVPFFVATDDDSKVIGFCYYGTYRPKAAYDRTVETTIYIATRAHRSGVGTRLYTRLIEEARLRGMHSLIACIGGENPGSRRLHEKLGFRHVGDLLEVGFKFEQWQNTHYYQLLL